MPSGGFQLTFSGLLQATTVFGFVNACARVESYPLGSRCRILFDYQGLSELLPWVEHITCFDTARGYGPFSNEGL